MEILHTYTDKVIFESDKESLQSALEDAVRRDICLDGALLMDAELFQADLSGASLSNANLNGARIGHVNFKGANLSNAHFTDATLDVTDFTDANLSGVNLGGARIKYSDLTRVNLCSANLQNVNFIGSIAHQTRLESVRCGSTNFVNVDLSSAYGLETIEHHNPSGIDISTLYKSQGKMPEIFLRGCGLPDEIISYYPSLISSAKAIDFYSCFISYSHANKSFAQRLHDQLQAKGIRCWLDSHEILPGDNIYKEIERGVRLWDKVLLCASKDSLTSGWVDDELKHAFAKEKKLFKDRGKEVLAVVPIDLDGYIFDEWEHPKKNQLMERLVVSFKGWENDNSLFEREFERVSKALRSDDFVRKPPPESKL